MTVKQETWTEKPDEAQQKQTVLHILGVYTDFATKSFIQALKVLEISIHFSILILPSLHKQLSSQ